MRTVAYADGIDCARIPPGEALAAAGLANDPHDEPEVLLAWTPHGPPWLATARGRTTMAGYALRDAVADGRIRYVPLRLSVVPRFAADLAPDVAVVAGIRRGEGLAFGASAGLGPALVRAAGAVVVEVDPAAADLGGPDIDGPIAAVVERVGNGDAAPTPRPPDDVDLAIGRRVAALLPDEPTLQFGPGGIADAIAAGIDRPVALWSGVVTDATAAFADRGLLIGTATTAYTWGGPAVEGLARAGRLDLLPVERTHDPSTVAGIERFVACNTAVQVGLDGAVNVERVGGRLVAGIGGHADFAAGATRAPGGMSIVALRSVTRRGGSTIVPRVETVSTARSDIGLVVTEHGVADLRGIDDDERARRLVAIAAPEHRAELERAVSSGASLPGAPKAPAS